MVHPDAFPNSSRGKGLPLRLPRRHSFRHALLSQALKGRPFLRTFYPITAFPAGLLSFPMDGEPAASLFRRESYSAPSLTTSSSSE